MHGNSDPIRMFPKDHFRLLGLLLGRGLIDNRNASEVATERCFNFDDPTMLQLIVEKRSVHGSANDQW